MGSVIDPGTWGRLEYAAKKIRGKSGSLDSRIRQAFDFNRGLGMISPSDLPESVRARYAEAKEIFERGSLSPDDAEGIKYRVLGVYDELRPDAPRPLTRRR